MARTFSAQVDAFVRKSKRRTTAVFRESVQRLGDEAQTLRVEGGNMPYDTGFLRASYMVSLDGVPFGDGVNPDRKGQYKYDSGPVELVIATAQYGDVLWGGWVAVYAKYMEHRYGYLRSAVQNWQSIVNGVVTEMKVRFP